MLWLFYVAWWTDLIGLVPGASAEARLLPITARPLTPPRRQMATARVAGHHVKRAHAASSGARGRRGATLGS
jgi:hypothetical protein